MMAAKRSTVASWLICDMRSLGQLVRNTLQSGNVRRRCSSIDIEYRRYLSTPFITSRMTLVAISMSTMSLPITRKS